MTNKEFSAIRRKLKLTQQAFGHALGFVDPQGQVSRIEIGKVAVSNQVEIIVRYMEKYGVLPEYQYKKPLPPEFLLEKESLK